MNSVREVVLEQHTKLLQVRGIDMQSNEEMEFVRNYAIDSLGIVELILSIEEELDVELDE